MKAAKKILFALTPLVTFLFVMETVLFIKGFEFHKFPRYLRFGFRNGIQETLPRSLRAKNQKHTKVFRRSPDLFWEPIPGRYRFNKQGRIGDIVQPGKHPGVFRIVALGDSCTMCGEPSYPEILKEQLKSRLPETAFETVNAGVAGYSSFQGLTLLRTRISDLLPNLLLISFGWNDLSLAYYYSDHEQKMPSQKWQRVRNLFSLLRTYQLLNYAVTSFQKYDFTLPGFSKNISFVKYRVPLNEFKKNLRAMVEISRPRKAMLLFITNPENFRYGVWPNPNLEGNRDPEHLSELRERYNQAVRKIASETDSDLVDLARTFRKLDDRTLTMLDRYHLSQKGLYLQAKLIADHIVGNWDRLNPKP